MQYSAFDTKILPIIVMRNVVSTIMVNAAEFQRRLLYAIQKRHEPILTPAKG